MRNAREIVGFKLLLLLLLLLLFFVEEAPIFWHFLKVGEFFSGGLLPRIECSLLIYFSQRTTLSSVSRFLSSSCVPLKTFGIVLLASNLGRISRISPPGVFSSSVACTDNTLRHLLSSNLSLLLWRRTLCGVRTYMSVYIYMCAYYVLCVFLRARFLF